MNDLPTSPTPEPDRFVEVDGRKVTHGDLDAGLTTWEYLAEVPDTAPTDGRWVAHNTVRPARNLGDRGFRAWLMDPAPGWEPCPCGWAPHLGTHYRRTLAPEVAR